MWKRDWYFYMVENELLHLPDYCFCSRATTLSVGLALKCDETEASRSENTLQNVKNYKITHKCQKKYIFAQTIFTHFWDSTGGTVTIEQLPIAMSQLLLKSTILYQIYCFLITFGELSRIFFAKIALFFTKSHFFLAHLVSYPYLCTQIQNKENKYANWT